MSHYQHTQKGFILLSLFGGCFFLLALLTIQLHNHWMGVGLLGFLSLCLYLFSSLTVQVSDSYVKLWFGPGIIRKIFLIEDIESTEVTKSPWYYGWGIHCIKGGFIFNVAGYYSVQLNMKNGKRYRIGTDEPEKLKEAIDSVLKNRGQKSEDRRQ